MKQPLAILIAASATLAGCTSLRTPYVQPAVAVSPAWKSPNTSAAASADQWWKAFGDPELNQLVERVLARNNDLAQAAILLRRARLQVGLAVTNPTVGANLNASGSDALRAGRTAFDSANAGLNVGYELDLFGKLAAARDVARWEAEATDQDLQAARLSLIANTVNFYYQIAYLNERVALVEQSLGYAQKTLDLVRVQRAAGSVSALEVAEAERNLATQQSTVRDLTRQRTEARNALDLLLNGETHRADVEPARLPDRSLPVVDAGLPADLLARRPDLQASELRLREQLASKDQIRLSYYPSISLTGSLGSSSTALTNVLSNPVGTLGAGLTLPFLQAGQMKLRNGVSRADYDRAVIGFRQTLYQAFAEVENALSARDQYGLQAADLAASLENARTAERLYEVRYRAGSTSLKTWLDAQENRRQAETALAQNRLNRLNTQVSLYKAVGGDSTLRASPFPAG
ncbi:MAG: efflux transporter outer membrane subunit [Caulobacteraceae bacterium]